MAMVKANQRSSGKREEPKKTGPDEDDVLRTKSMQEVTGIPSLPFDYVTDESMVENSPWITKRGRKTIPIDEEDDKTEYLIQFTKEDVQEEIAYCSNTVYCFVLRPNPPWEVLNGFIYRIWHKHNIDKVSFLPNGIFLVRFKEGKDRDEILQAWHFLFDNKPLMYWGKCLPTIVGLLGKFQRAYQATIDKTRLRFARVMVKVVLGQKFPTKIKFLDENGTKVVAPDIEYEWKPTICTKCKGIGYDQANCRGGVKPTTQQVPMKNIWRPVGVKTQGATLPTIDKPKGMSTLMVTTPIKQMDSTGISHEKSYRDAASGNVTPGVGVGQNEVGLFGFLETKVNGASVSNISTTMLDGWSVTTNNGSHKRGRVWILWRPILFDVQILQYDAQFIHTKVVARVSQQCFFLTMVYAFNEGTARRDLWEKLERINGQWNGPCPIVGDFNTVITPDERVGENTKQSYMDEFIECLANCEVADLAATGAFYTWTNKQEPQTRVYSRLAGFLVNQEWQDQFPDMLAHYHPAGLFDHSPCTVSNTKLDITKRANFKYFNMWGRAPSFLPRVKDEWEKNYTGHKMFSVIKRLKALKPTLKQLNKECYADIETSTIIAEKELEDIQLLIERKP
ncbi:uncharacterized protein LOC141607602 [Silene latifolia]|uniref:uncharacterized protein LOC141607602 n=1 Tax=Silene latifolia TaxID=37657 RepID=UPI003D77E06C